MKKIRVILLATFMVGLGFASVNAQDKTWVVSKDVQKVANKKQYENTESEKSHLKPTSYSFPAVVLSKDVQKVSNPSLQNQAPQGNDNFALQALSATRQRDSPCPEWIGGDHRKYDYWEGEERVCVLCLLLVL
jgi:hypothetical protein